MEINYEKCVEGKSKCSVQCMDACSVTGALSAIPPNGGIIAIYYTNCTSCGKCIKACPEGAISHIQHVLNHSKVETITLKWCNQCEDHCQTVQCDRCEVEGCTCDLGWGGHECNLCPKCLKELLELKSDEDVITLTEKGKEFVNNNPEGGRG